MCLLNRKNNADNTRLKNPYSGKGNEIKGIDKSELEIMQMILRLKTKHS